MAKKTAPKPAKKPAPKAHGRPRPVGSDADPAAPDLSHIAEGLRYLAKPLDQLLPDPHNARRHDERNLATIRASLLAYGQTRTLTVRPISIDDAKAQGWQPLGSSDAQPCVVLKGNGTLAAARALGLTHLACVTVDDDDATALAYAIGDNRSSELATWDHDGLQRLIAEVQHDSPIGDLLADLDADSRRLCEEAQQPATPRSDAGDDDPTPAPPTTTKKTRANTKRRAGEDESSSPEPTGTERWCLVTCPDESTQHELLDEFTRRGHECRRTGTAE